MQNIILCGGSGTRLWPVSRTLMPKQFVKLFDQKSLFQLTVERNQACCSGLKIISNIDQYFLALDQIEAIEKVESVQVDYLLEPFGRNTAPAIALACFDLPEEEVVLVTPSDHLIKDLASYYQAVEQAKHYAQQDQLVTFGITPSHPETGFGYIEADGHDVKAFHEKPDKQTAQHYLDQGNYYWNSGIFCFKAGVYLSELQQHDPDTYQKCLKAHQSLKPQSPQRIPEVIMEQLPDQSIDYAVMEKSAEIKVIPVNMGWSDLGSFDALDQELPKDSQGNTCYSHLLTEGAQNNFIYGQGRTIALTDVSDLIIVDTADALLITQKGQSQNVKKIVYQLKHKQSELHHTHLTTHRPWGTYTILEDTPGYKIKTITVKPGQRLSLQQHLHRSEHWVVVSGTATVTVGQETRLVRPNESTYIKMGELHRLENQGKIPVILIEVQVGEYTGEDDIVRHDDDYQRL